MCSPHTWGWIDVLCSFLVFPNLTESEKVEITYVVKHHLIAQFCLCKEFVFKNHFSSNIRMIAETLSAPNPLFLAI